MPILTSEDVAPSNTFGLLHVRILSLWVQRNKGLPLFLTKQKGIQFLKRYLFIYLCLEHDGQMLKAQ